MGEPATFECLSILRFNCYCMRQIHLLRAICWTVPWGVSGDLVQDWSCTIDYYRLLQSAHVWEVPGVLDLDWSCKRLIKNLFIFCHQFSISPVTMFIAVLHSQVADVNQKLHRIQFSSVVCHHHMVYVVFAWPRQPVWLKYSFYICLWLTGSLMFKS